MLVFSNKQYLELFQQPRYLTAAPASSPLRTSRGAIGGSSGTCSTEIALAECATTNSRAPSHHSNAYMCAQLSIGLCLVVLSFNELADVCDAIRVTQRAKDGNPNINLLCGQDYNLNQIAINQYFIFDICAAFFRSKPILIDFKISQEKEVMKFVDKLKAVQGKLFINGKYVESKGGELFPVINPATEEIIDHAVAGTVEDVDEAVKAARQQFDGGQWSKVDPHERGRILSRFADLIDKNTEWLAYFETLNNGKTLTTSLTEDIPFTAYIYRYFAGQTDKIKGSTLQMNKPFFGMTKKEPIGVVGQIIPWNYPLLMMAWKVAPALAAGCTVVLKPAEQTPFTALMLGELFNEAGFPPGVINIVTGFGKTGEAVSQHSGINKISFTGSTEVGYLIMKNSHKHNLKPITLELGGKSANIILPDADIDKSIEQACMLFFNNNGQSCVAGSRTFVHESIYDKFVEGCIKVAEGITVGDPMEKSNTLGAIVSKEQFDRILYYIEEGKKAGAKAVAGGHRVGEKGYFVKPTIFTQVTDQMIIAKQEIFGPVMSILRWSDEDEVIKRANSLPYGLGAGIMSNNINKVLKFTDKLKAGTVYVNCYDYTEATTPFGGYKDSGIGKDLGDEGLESYLLTKTVIIKQLE